VTPRHLAGKTAQARTLPELGKMKRDHWPSQAVGLLILTSDTGLIVEILL
jgi:hypothetical protein